MKRVFALFTLFAMLLVACESGGDDTKPAGNPGGEQGKPEDANKEYVLSLATKSVMEFEAEGGKGEIGYTLTEETRAHETPDMDIPTEGVVTGDSAAEKTTGQEESKVKVACDADWITDIVVAEVITFNVLPNEEGERETMVVVSYEDQKFQVLVRQLGDTPAVDVEFRATHLNGTYFGKLETYTYNYFIILSDTGLPGMNISVDGGTQYRFDLYSDVTSAFEPVDYVPEGVYVFGEYTPGTIDAAQSCYISANGDEMAFASAKLTVTENKIVAEVRMMNGKIHHVTYEGSLALDYTEPTASDIKASALTADAAFDVKGGSIMAYYRGDFYGKGADVWFLHMIADRATFSGTYLMMDLMVDKSQGGYDNKEGFVGEYTVLNHTMEDFAGTFAPGCLRDDRTQLHTWYMNCVGGVIDTSNGAPFVDGKITVAKEGEEYILTMDGVDDIGNKIQGSFRGKVVEYQNQANDL